MSETGELREPTFWRTVLQIARREIVSRLRSKAFLGMSAVLLIGAALATVLPNVLGGTEPVPVAVIGQPDFNVETLKDPGGTPYFTVKASNVDRDRAVRMVRDGKVDAALDFSDELTVIGLRESPDRAVEAFSAAPAVELVDANARDPLVIYFVAISFGVAFFLAATLFGNQIAQSVVEEKSTRIVEILLSAVSARALLTGKILGNSLLAIGQVVALAVVAIAGLAATGGRIDLGDLGPAILWFVAYFVCGFVMVSSMFAAAASTISRSEDVGSVTSPVTTLIMVPYILSFVTSGNETLTRVLAWLPISSPIAMPTLVFTGNAMWWEPIGGLVILLVTTFCVIAIGEVIYRNSLLRTGARVRLRDALSS